MSLINKMLQDLDARGNVRLDGVPPDIKPVGKEPRGLPARRIAAITAALLAVALGLTAWLVLPLKGKTYDEQPAAILVPALVTSPSPPAAPASAAAQPALAAPAVPDPTPVTVVEVAPEAGAGASAAEKVSAEKAEAEKVAASAAANESPPPNPPAVASRRGQAAVAMDAPAPAHGAAPQAARPQRAGGIASAPAPAAAPASDDAVQPAGATTSWAVASERALAEEIRLAKRWRAEEARIATLPKGERPGAEGRLREEQARAATRAKADAAWLAALKRKEAAAGAAVDEPRAPAAPATGAPSRAQGRIETSSPGAENAYRRALATLQDGRINEAIAGLQGTLRINPKHEAARQTLVGLLIESNRGDEAMLQLQQALALDARQPALAMLLARLQIERGKTGIDTLLRTLPYASGMGEYHAFLAGALGRQARHAEAAEQYQTALRSAPGNAVWWMGLGIALQADKRNAEALDAFRQAKGLGTLSVDLQSFVERKIQQLAR